MFILLTIFIIILLIQIILAFYAWSTKGMLRNQYSYVLGEQIEPHEVVEKYLTNHLKKKEKLQIVLSDELTEPAFAEREILILSKSHLYDNLLYPNYYVIYQAELAKLKNSNIRKFGQILNALFFIQILLMIVSIALNINTREWVMMAAIFVQIITIFTSIFGFFRLSSLLDDVQDLAIKILVLDDVEEARADSLRNDLSYSVYEYPFEIVWRVMQFLRF